LARYEIHDLTGESGAARLEAVAAGGDFSQ
jgi:hypothetical protein